MVAALVRVGEHVELALLDPVLHVAARAVDALVERPGVDLFGRQGGHHEPRVGAVLAAVRHPLGLGYHPPAPGPAVECGPAEVGKPAGRLTGPLRLILGPGEIDVDLVDQPGVACETVALAGAEGT
jgi:hypothetical protein